MGSITRNRTNEAIKEAYREWLRIPRQVRLAEKNKPNPRFPSTREEFCKMYGVSRQTLWRWEQDPEFFASLSQDIMGLITLDELIQMIEVQKQKALRGDRNSFKLLMDYMKFPLDKLIAMNAEKEVEKEYDFSKMSDEELEKLLDDDDVDC